MGAKRREERTINVCTFPPIAGKSGQGLGCSLSCGTNSHGGQGSERVSIKASGPIRGLVGILLASWREPTLTAVTSMPM